MLNRNQRVRTITSRRGIVVTIHAMLATVLHTREDSEQRSEWASEVSPR